MTQFDREKFREAIYRAKLYVYITRSMDPEIKEKLEQMRPLVDKLQELCDEILRD